MSFGACPSYGFYYLLNYYIIKLYLWIGRAAFLGVDHNSRFLFDCSPAIFVQAIEIIILQYSWMGVQVNRCLCQLFIALFPYRILGVFKQTEIQRVLQYYTRSVDGFVLCFFATEDYKTLFRCGWYNNNIRYLNNNDNNMLAAIRHVRRADYNNIVVARS